MVNQISKTNFQETKLFFLRSKIILGTPADLTEGIIRKKINSPVENWK